MAGDWLKFDKATPDKPEVIVMAAALRITRDEVVGKLLRVWAWADTVSIDGAAVGVPEGFIDELVNKKGFAAALRAAGWLDGEDFRLTFSNFSRHNGSTAKARAESNRRMASSREKRNSGCGIVAEKAQQKAQPEKRREEKSESKDSLPQTPKGAYVGESVGLMDELKARISALKPEWGKPTRWSYAEDQTLFGGSAAQMQEMEDHDWKLISDYLNTRMPQGANYWQPRNRDKFCETFANTWADARRWADNTGRVVRPQTKSDSIWK